MVTIFLVAVRVRRFAVSAVADHACLPPSVCVIVVKFVKFRVQTAARINERMPTMLEGVVVFVGDSGSVYRPSCCRSSDWIV